MQIWELLNSAIFVGFISAGFLGLLGLLISNRFNKKRALMNLQANVIREFAQALSECFINLELPDPYSYIKDIKSSLTKIRTNQVIGLVFCPTKRYMEISAIVTSNLHDLSNELIKRQGAITDNPQDNFLHIKTQILTGLIINEISKYANLPLKANKHKYSDTLDKDKFPNLFKAIKELKEEGYIQS